MTGRGLRDTVDIQPVGMLVWAVYNSVIVQKSTFRI